MQAILMKLLIKCMTERFVSKMVVHGLTALAKSTKNDIDDKVVNDIAEALAVKG